MRLMIVLPAVFTAAVVTTAGTYWAAASDGHHSRASAAVTSPAVTASPTFGSSTTAPSPAAGPSATTKPKPKPSTTRAAAPPTVQAAAATAPAGPPASVARPPAPTRRPTYAPPPSSSPIASAVFNLLNQQRKQNALPPLRWSNQLASSAQYHNRWMDKAQKMVHQETGEPSEADRISATGFPWSSFAENIGESFQTDQSGAIQLQELMYNETPPKNGHRVTILSKTYTDVGIDVLIDQKTGTLWLTEDFARRS